ncbi:hypothetical protein [Nocardioides sp. Root151]|uniref:hypothetical protein n=1 Tax=Nocardioides sp. Root151 TaxID=1736475 RepID=UPI000AC25C4A|nr:hypothetical protein [Nocardioides sp. Root151]
MLTSSVGALRRHWPLWLALLVVVAGRIVLWDWPITPDESGFYLVADDLLHRGGDGLYGHYWVDRPPMLIWLFMVAAAIGTVEAIRWMVAAFFLAFVVLTYCAVRRLGGAAGWAALVAAAFSITPAVGAPVANGEAFAIPFVMGCVLCAAIAARHEGGRGLAWSAAAGLVGLLAIAVKQNFAEGLVFAFVVLVVAGLRKERTWPDVARRLLAGLAGIAGGVGMMVGWAFSAPTGVNGLWVAAISFRGDASSLIRAGYRTGIENRTAAIVEDAWLSGIIPMLIVLVVVALVGRFRGSALGWAVAAMIAVEAVGILVGGNFWTHYLLGLAPGLALAVGLTMPLARRRWLVLPVVVYVIGSALWVTPTEAKEMADYGTPRLTVLGEFVAASAEPGDTATTLYGRADAQRASGLRSPYEHLWSLPIRVLDPDLDELIGVLQGDDPPTWLMQVFPLHAWGLDPAERIGGVILDRYDLVYDDCHVRVFLLKSVDRDLASPPTC